MEVELEEKAFEVTLRMIEEDDTSVEVACLGGFFLYTIGQKARESKNADEESWKETWASSRRWLSTCLRLFDAQDYEDDKLGEHAKEILAVIVSEIGEAPDDDEEDWVDSEGADEEDEEMA